MALRVRWGNKENLEPDRLQPGEPVMVSDTSSPGMKMGNGEMAWFMSKAKTLDAAHTANAVETQTVNLGFRPRYVRIRAQFGINNGAAYDSDGVSDGTSQCCFFKYGNGISAPNVSEYVIVEIHSGNGGNSANITFTDTGYTLAWTQTGTTLPTGTIMMLVTAIG